MALSATPAHAIAAPAPVLPHLVTGSIARHIWGALERGGRAGRAHGRRDRFRACRRDRRSRP